LIDEGEDEKGAVRRGERREGRGGCGVFVMSFYHTFWHVALGTGSLKLVLLGLGCDLRSIRACMVKA